MKLIRLTPNDSLRINFLPFTVETTREDGEFTITFYRQWGIQNEDFDTEVRMTTDELETQTFFQIRQFGPFTLTRVPEPRR